ncbi:MAG: helix-hairpin-helix domain-containing protein [Candidatus Omnitrophica bacterium]|jgi:competence ComEA-like helix-hairpin-helix protein|nr:helix-hairpin-helix domain-containing protein [Candidatus Omnitrophota bacterium]MDD5078078.1 helix-hairpin-helix domain-containing protein [Candidatus Omnitrophota bacterium]MDD5724755.1 helix-hairpin-helix domain-containing protein [Candidatus Omnitrophota bacterium]
MVYFTSEEKKAFLFIFALALSGLALNWLIKSDSRISGVVYPRPQLARLDLNRATLDELKHSRCVPAGLSVLIIEYRDAHGGIRRLEDLKEVKGVGPRRLDKIRERFFVE